MPTNTGSIGQFKRSPTTSKPSNNTKTQPKSNGDKSSLNKMKNKKK